MLKTPNRDAERSFASIHQQSFISILIGSIGSVIITAASMYTALRASMYTALRMSVLPWPTIFVAVLSMALLKMMGNTTFNEINTAKIAMSAGGFRSARRRRYNGCNCSNF